MNTDDKIYVAGHRGLVGSGILRLLQQRKFKRIVTRTREELDLTNQAAVQEFFEMEKPSYVFLAAARVGGIYANSTYPADFIRDNLQIQTHVIDSAWRSGTKKLLFLGSSCIYPKLAPQPIKEESLLTGELETTNEWYAIAKIAGIKMCQAYRKQYGFNVIAVMPTNLYGPGDNFNLETSHVLPALIRKFHEAKEQGQPQVTIWGTGKPKREFLHVDDMADAAIFMMQNYDSPKIVNIGTGEEITIADLAILVKEVVEYGGSIEFDHTKPDGTMRKLVDVTYLQQVGWQAKISLLDGVRTTYTWFLKHSGEFRQ